MVFSLGIRGRYDIKLIISQTKDYLHKMRE